MMRNSLEWLAIPQEVTFKKIARHIQDPSLDGAKSPAAGSAKKGKGKAVGEGLEDKDVVSCAPLVLLVGGREGGRDEGREVERGGGREGGREEGRGREMEVEEEGERGCERERE